MDIIMVSAGKQELEDALRTLIHARRNIETGVGTGTDDPLKYSLEATRYGWAGDEIILLDGMIASTEKLIARINATQIDKETLVLSWKENIPDEVWEHIQPIAESIDFPKMLESYTYGHRKAVLHEEGDNLSDSIESYIYDGLTNLVTYGINITIEDIVAKCDMEGYSCLPHLVNDKSDMFGDAKPEHWAYHMLTYFLDVLLAYDGYNADMYDVDRVCRRALS